jgi:hypothetical protein
VTDLQELLRRATEIEAAVVAPAEPEVKAVEPDPGVLVLEALVERMEVLAASVKALADAPAVAAVVEADVADADFAAMEAEVDAIDAAAAVAAADLGASVKADGMVCPKCGSKDIDEFEDGSASCAECGADVPVGEGKADEGYDFDDTGEDFLDEKAWDDLDAAADEALEQKSALAADGRVVLSEVELMRGRRLALED